MYEAFQQYKAGGEVVINSQKIATAIVFRTFVTNIVYNSVK